MKKIFFPLVIMVSFLQNCKKNEEINPVNKPKESITNSIVPERSLKEEKPNKPEDFVPKGFRIFEKTEGDLNGDGEADCVLIIKGTDKDKFINHEYRGELDRNRRGLVILFKKGNHYTLALKNETCFSSENEEGGVYFAPELVVSAEKGKLFVHYAHGRYGYWAYTFQYRNSDFYLIGYDSSENHGPIVQTITSINYLTGKKQVKDNINKYEGDADEVFEETWTKIDSKRLTKLSEIKDFDDLL